MTRRSLALLAIIAALLGAAFVSSLPARASHPRAIDPSQIDPNALKLPSSIVPATPTICLTGSTNSAGQVTAGTVTVASSASGAIACGTLDALTPPTASSAGSITIGGKVIAIAPGATTNGTNPSITGISAVTCGFHSAVSNNDDADVKTTPADGCSTQLRIAHQNSYASLGRITGYRMDFVFSLQGSIAGTEYLASIFPSAAAAQAAMADSTTLPAIITIVKTGTFACSAGDQCLAFYGPNPALPGNNAVYAVFTRGPIMVESGSQVSSAQFAQLEPALASTLNSFLVSADQVVQAALNGSTPNTPSAVTNTPAVTSTATATATATATLRPTATTTLVPLTLTVSVAHGTVAVGKKQTITVETAPDADVKIVLAFPNGSKKTFTGSADASGTAAWTFKQPAGKTKGSNNTVKVTVTVSRGSEPSKSATKKYKIK